MAYQYYTLEDLKAQPELLENHPLNARFRLTDFITKKFYRLSGVKPELRLFAQNQEEKTEIILFEQRFAERAHFDKQGMLIDKEQSILLNQQRRYDEVDSVSHLTYHGLCVWQAKYVVYFTVAISKTYHTVAEREFKITYRLANPKACRLTMIGRFNASGEVDYTVPYEYYYPALSSNEQAAISADFSASVLPMLDGIKSAIAQEHEKIYLEFRQSPRYQDYALNWDLSLETLTTKPAKNIYELYPAEIAGYIQIDPHSGELGLPILNSLKPAFYSGLYENSKREFREKNLVFHRNLVFHSQQKNITFILYSFPTHFSSMAPTLYKVYAIINRTWLVVFDFDKFFKVIFKEENGKKIACFKLGGANISVLADLRHSQPPLDEIIFTWQRKEKPLEVFSYADNKPQPILQPFIKDLICDVKMLLRTLAPLLVTRETILQCFNQEKYEKALTLEELIYDAVELDFRPSGITNPENSLKLLDYWLIENDGDSKNVKDGISNIKDWLTKKYKLIRKSPLFLKLEFSLPSRETFIPLALGLLVGFFSKKHIILGSFSSTIPFLLVLFGVLTLVLLIKNMRVDYETMNLCMIASNVNRTKYKSNEWNRVSFKLMLKTFGRRYFVTVTLAILLIIMGVSSA